MSVLFGVSGISLGIITGNETIITYDVLVDSLYVCGTRIYIFNFSPRISLTKALFSVNIEALNVFSIVHENMVLHATNSPR